jgi:hypothetical protein
MPNTKKTDKKNKSTKKTVEAPVAVPAPVVAQPPVKTEAEKIWEEIQNRTIYMFGLPGQIISQHCNVVPVEPSSLYVVIRSSATLPSLETAVSPDFTVELADKFVIIRRAPKPLVPNKR